MFTRNVGKNPTFLSPTASGGTTTCSHRVFTKREKVEVLFAIVKGVSRSYQQKLFFPLVQCTFERMIRTSGYERHSKAEKNLHSDASLAKLGHLLKTDFSSSGGNTYDLC